MMRTSHTIARMILLVALPAGGTAADHSESEPRQLAELSLEDLMKISVQAAAMHKQDAGEAPASVTVVTREEIRRYGYRTLAEALNCVRGFYITSDHSYLYPGLRGFNLPGDFSTRFLVLINGHNVVSSVDNSVSAFGQDFGLDMNLIEQIEIIRGPSSALYGSNGIFATINIVTRKPQDFPEAEVGIEVGSFGEKKIQAASSIRIGKEADLLVSASVLNNTGEGTIYLPEFDAPGTNFGRAVRMDGEKGYHLFVNLTWRDWSFVGMFGDRQKIQPISWSETVFNDRGTRIEDTRDFVEARYQKDLGSGRQFTWRAYFDSVRFSGVYRYPLDPGVEDSRELDSGDWLGTQASVRLNGRKLGMLTLGVEGREELRTQVSLVNVSPQYEQVLRLNKPDAAGAIFAQDELPLSRQLQLSLGARFDISKNHGNFASPRAALVYQPTTRSSYKFLYGRAFRNPSVYEQYFDDGGVTGVANLKARPEHSDSFELVAEQRPNQHFQALVSVYRNALDDLLVATYTDTGAVQFQNTGKIRAAGVEGELTARTQNGLELLASFAVQRTIDAGSRWALANSPGRLGKLRVGVPLLQRKVSFSAALSYMSERRTNSQAVLPSVFLADATLTPLRIGRSLEFQTGVRNLLNRQYVQPIQMVPTVDTICAAGRTFFVTLTWRLGETGTRQSGSRK